MFLDYIEINNFRPYYGHQRIDFGFNENENLTVILADNGSGKTSLVNALTWCLYGKELHDVRDKLEPLYNLKAAEKADSEDLNEIKVSVKIRFYYFDDDLNKKFFNVSREISYQKWVDDQWSSEYDSYVIVDETGEEPLDRDSAQYAIDNKIPQNMFQYFFFNGATLSNYFDTNEKDLTLKKSIKQISQIELIDSMSNHLSSTLTALNRRYDKLRPKDQKNYNLLIENKISKREELDSQIKDNHEKIDDAHELVIKFENNLKKVDSNHVKELTNRRDDLNDEKISLTASINNSTREYDDLILELFPIAALFDEFVESIEIADKSRQTKSAPPQIERTLLNDILDDGYCICGVKLEDHPECVEELKNRLKNTSKIKNEDFYKDYYEIKDVLRKLKDLPKIEKLRNSIQTNSARLNSVKLELKEISDELTSIDEENVALWEEQRDKNQKLIDKLRKKNTSLAKQIEKIKNDIVTLKKERDKTIGIKGELKVLSDKIEFCETAMDVVSTLNDDVQKHIRQKVNDKTREQFINIDWAYDKYTDVTIENDYRITVTKSSGSKVRPGDLSDGEENLLALSFMMALHSLSGFEIPLIIDAPLEKLDKGKRLEFISGLHDYTKDKQIVFLFTDSQYTDDVRANMLKNIVDEYELKPFENKTEIVKHEQ